MAEEQQGLLQQAQQAPSQEQATPEEQEWYDRVVTAAMRIITEPKSNRQMIAVLERQGYNEDAIADAAVKIVLTIDAKSEGAIPDAVVVPATQEVVDILIDYLTKLRKTDESRLNMERIASSLAQKLSEAYGSNEQDVQDLTNDMDGAELTEAASYGEQIA